LVLLHLDGSEHFLPQVGDAVFVAGEEKQRGTVTSVAQHYEMGPIALAVISRSIDENAALLVRGDNREYLANQEVIVPASAGKAADIPKRNLLMGKWH
jgi:folate-binding Fe-S cluster repair protein YgfZ